MKSLRRNLINTQEKACFVLTFVPMFVPKYPIDTVIRQSVPREYIPLTLYLVQDIVGSWIVRQNMYDKYALRDIPHIALLSVVTPVPLYC